MNNTDKIIKYLSGEMQREEVKHFELLRSSDPELENAFQSIRKIWELTRENLMLEDLPEEKIRDQLIAEIIAQHDIELYRNQEPTKKTEAFGSALNEAVATAQQKKNQQNSRSKWSTTPMILLIAASLVLLFLVLRPSKSLQELAVSYYDPAGSELASEHDFKTRSNEARALQFFRDENYAAARYQFEIDLGTITNDPMARLFYGITCRETGDTQKAISILEMLINSSSNEVEQEAAYHAKWYLSLIYIEDGVTEKAIPYLIDLSRSEGPFNKNSTRLMRKIE